MDRDVIRMYTHLGEPTYELSVAAGNLLSMTRSEEINGAHELSVEATVLLNVGDRAVTCDAMGKWHEWVVNEVTESYDASGHRTCSYNMVWSLQHDLTCVWHDAQTEAELQQPGVASPTNAMVALRSALYPTKRWRPGKCDVKTKSGVVMHQMSVWDALKLVVSYWGGEIDADITVDDTGVISRKVDLLSHLGPTEWTRWLQTGVNLQSLERRYPPGPRYSRLIPYMSGTQEKTAGNRTFEWKLGIADQRVSRYHPRGASYLRDDTHEKAYRLPDGLGGYEYPTIGIDYSAESQEELLSMAIQDLSFGNRLGPLLKQDGYDATISQADPLEPQKMMLGEEVRVTTTSNDAYKRVVKIEVDELGVNDVSLTIGCIDMTLEKYVTAIARVTGGDDINGEEYVLGGDPSSGATGTTLGHYTVTKPDAGTVSVPSYDVPDYSSSLSGLDSRLSSLETGGIGGGLLGDDIIHQLDGVKIPSGSVINFTTSGETGGSDSGESTRPSREKWGSTGTGTPKNATWGAHADFGD